MLSPDIFTYVTTEESKFQTDQLRLGDNWTWNFRDHVQLIFHLKNGVFYTGENNWMRAFKNIMRPLINLAKWTEDIEVKDVAFFIENKMGRVLSFLVKKYHDEVYVREHNLDTLFDRLAESDITYGGVLVKKTDTPLPEVIKLKEIAFCDQTDILGGPIAFKHYFSPDKLKKMSEYGWGDKKNGATISLDELCVIAEPEKTVSALGDEKMKTPGKHIEVYIVYGNLPEHYLKDNHDMEYYCNQVQIIAYYHDKDSQRQGVTLYRKEEKDDIFKFLTSEEVEGRALGYGEGEAMLHPQIWTNFLTIHKTALLEAASKIPLYTDDPTYTQRNKIQDMDNLEVTTIEEGKRIYQVPTAAVANIGLHERSINEWYEHAQLTGSAFDPIQGKEAVSGTTFRGQERLVAQGRGLHDRRRGQRAKFIEELYRDWIIPSMVREIVKGKEFLATLTTDEITWVADQLAENYASRQQFDEVVRGQIVSDKEQLKQTFKAAFSKTGNKQLIKILKDEFKGVEIKMGINVAGKQKDLAGISDKILSIIQFVFSNPQGFQQTMQIPGMAKAFQDILEYGGLNGVDFAAVATMPPPAPPTASPMASPMRVAQPA